MSVMQWLYDTGVGVYMRESLWGYPIALSVHAIGMGLLVGVLIAIDLRLIGLFREIPIRFLPRLMPLAWIGFVLNAATGVLLFVSDPPAFIANPAFLIKIAAIVVGTAIAALRQRSAAFASSPGLPAHAPVDAKMRGYALASLGCWTAAIVAGRMIAYLAD